MPATTRWKVNPVSNRKVCLRVVIFAVNHQSLQLLRYIDNHSSPVARGFLAENPRGGIPGRVTALQKPAPLAGMSKHNPDRLSLCSREVSNRRIDADHHVKVFNQGSRICEIRQFFTQTINLRHGLEHPPVLVWNFLLQTYNLYVKARQGIKDFQSHVARAVHGFASAARPDKTNPQSCARSKLNSPVFNLIGFWAQIGNIRGD